MKNTQYYQQYKTLQVGNWRSAFNELGEREEKMYDISLLNSSSKTLNDLPPNLIVRPLQLSDYDKGAQETNIENDNQKLQNLSIELLINFEFGA